MRWLGLAPIGAIALACSDAIAPNTSPTSIRLHSDAGDFVGSGQTYEYDLTNALVLVNARTDTFGIYIRGDEEWTGVFTIPHTHARLEPGFYPGATRFPYNDPAGTGLSWFGTNGCDKLTGSFLIGGVSYDDMTLTAIDFSFEQHCEGFRPALRGTIHWRADDPTRPPGPVNPVPAGLWQPPAGATPTGVNYVYLLSDPSDPIGAGSTYTYTPANATVGLQTSNGELTVSVGTANGLEWWIGDFKPMNTLSALQVGYYAGAGRFVNPTKGGLDWSGNGRGCNTLRGWFAIDHVTYAADSITTVDLRFEQHCEGVTPALHGAMHWAR